MNRFLRHPATNAVGISVFSIFYGVIFLCCSGLIKSQTGLDTDPLMKIWDAFLNLNGHIYTAIFLLTLTAVVVALLLIKHKPYDEYHTSILIKCLVISVALILAAIAAFFVVILFEPEGIISKFTFFVTANWVIVVFADLTYLLICRRR